MFRRPARTEVSAAVVVSSRAASFVALLEPRWRAPCEGAQQPPGAPCISHAQRREGDFVDHKPYDVSVKELIWDGPAACVERFVGPPPGPVDLIDSDITALTAAADKVIRVGGPSPYLVILEPQASRDPDLVCNLWFRQAALHRRHRLPVLTVLILLRRQAEARDITGIFEVRMPDGRRTNVYNYQVVKLWEEDPDAYLTAPVNLVPLAPLTDVKENELPAVMRRMAARINAEPESHAELLWTATYLLMGLSYSKEVVSQLLRGVVKMRESSTFQAILQEGREEGLITGRKEGRTEGLKEGRILGEQQLLIRMGTKRFGEPDRATLAAIKAIRSIRRLESLCDRILDGDDRDWDGLIGKPKAR